MIIVCPKTSDSGRPGKDEKAAEVRAGDDCRCKEASNMPPLAGFSNELPGLQAPNFSCPVA